MKVGFDWTDMTTGALPQLITVSAGPITGAALPSMRMP